MADKTDRQARLAHLGNNLQDAAAREDWDRLGEQVRALFPALRALAAQGKLTDAESQLLAGYESLRDLPSTPPPRRRSAVEQLVSFYASTGKTAEAATWRRRLAVGKHLKAAHYNSDIIATP